MKKYYSVNLTKMGLVYGFENRREADKSAIELQRLNPDFEYVVVKVLGAVKKAKPQFEVIEVE